MPSFKQPLSQNPRHLWGVRGNGGADIDPENLAIDLRDSVKDLMEDKFSMNVRAEMTDISIGGFLSKKTHPGVLFSFPGHDDYANVLVGFTKTAGIISVDAVQQGNTSTAMQRLEAANSKGRFSLTGALQRAITDESAVQEEVFHYEALLTSIQAAAGTWFL